jgi:predicted MFS family arabinose efflux permease
VLGPAILQRFNDGTVHKMRRLIIIGYACISLGWFLFSGAPTLLLAALALTIKAMGSSVYWTYSSSILQKTVDDEYLGRMFSLDLTGFGLATVISVIITGVLLEKSGDAGVRAVVFATGLASLIPLILWTLAVPRIERFKDPDRYLEPETEPEPA